MTFFYKLIQNEKPKGSQLLSTKSKNRFEIPKETFVG